jgi:flagella basal body P-ring formation protein FlgA
MMISRPSVKNIVTLFLLAALCALAIASANAQVLRPRTLVEGEMIRLGDLFAALPAEAADRAVAPAPAPGRTTQFDSTALAQVARDNALAWSPQTRFDRVVVQRASRPITAEEIENRVLAALQADGLPDDMKIELLNRRLSLDAATGPGSAFEIQSLSYDKRDGGFVATLAVDAGADATMPVEVRGVVFRTARVPVLARPLRHGQVIGPDDIAWKDTRASAVDPNLALDPDAIFGKTPRTSLRAGEPLRRAELMAPVVVAKGDLVTMVLTAPQMMLTAQGRAAENGADGQVIKVENTRSKTTVEAIVIGPNRVAVHLPSLAALTK